MEYVFKLQPNFNRAGKADQQDQEADDGGRAAQGAGREEEEAAGEADGEAAEEEERGEGRREQRGVAAERPRQEPHREVDENAEGKFVYLLM